MRTSSLVFIALVLQFAAPASASLVIHDGRPGIVAFSEGYVLALDSNGHVWGVGSGWSHVEADDPPMPVEEILFWDGRWLITVGGESWYDNDNGVGWISQGYWPDAPAGISEPPAASESIQLSPNPSLGLCRLSFHVLAEGPVSVLVLDVSGRIVRRLLDGPHPAGDYSLVWDGQDADHRDLPAGVYFARVVTTEGTTSSRVVLAR